MYNFLKIEEVVDGIFNYSKLFSVIKTNKYIQKGNNIIYDDIVYEIKEIDTVYFKTTDNIIIEKEINIYVEEKQLVVD